MVVRCLTCLTASAIMAVSSIGLAFDEITDIDNLSLADFMNVEVESASRLSEKLEEAPVPVTVITRRMLDESGVRTLAEALDKFVPGYQHLQDRNSTIFAARGIHATAQQKVLIMINGNRLNDRAILTEPTTHGLALHNVKRIEVLRGGGSALYGNVAIAGAVNLVTFKASELDERNHAEISMGNQGQRRLRLMHGYSEGDTDLLLWGHIYGSSGQKIDVDGSEPFYEDLASPPSNTRGSILVGRVEDPGASEFGATYKKGDFSIFARRSVDSTHEPYGSNFAVYDNNAISTLAGGGPGEFFEKNNLSFKYDMKVSDQTTLTINPYYDSLTYQISLVTDGTPGDEKVTAGVWHNRDIGLTLYANTDYQTGAGRGSILYGVQADAFEVYDSILLTSDGGLPGDFDSRDPNTSKNNKFLNTGGEQIYSAFIQNKHYLSEYLIGNMGVRYDSIQTKPGGEKSALSPRLALVYLPNENWEYKLSYTQSFVDAPYWYRYSQLSAFSGSEFLDPEFDQFVQFQTTWKSSSKKLRSSTVFFHQNATDIIVGVGGSCGSSSNPCYVNAGKLTNAGVENEFAYLGDKFSLIFKAEWSTVLDSDGYSTQNDTVEDVSQLQGSFVGSYYFTKQVLANLNLRYLGAQEVSDALNNDDARTPGYTILDLGYRHESFFIKNMWLDLRLTNALDTEWYQGGTSIPFRQPGRWYLASLGYKF